MRQPHPGMMFTILVLLVFLAPARADDGNQILAKVDKAEYGPKDSQAILRLELVDPSGSMSRRKMKMVQKGSEKRLIQFLEPADVKGMAFLDAGDDKMYLYLPAMHKIRRIAGHVKNDNFAGTDFSYDDLSADLFTNRMNVTKVEEMPDAYLLELAPKPTVDIPYSRLEMHVRKSDFLFDKLVFFDKSGTRWKEMSRKDIKVVDGYPVSHFTELKDLKKNHVTRSIMESIRFDQNIQDRFFSKRQLKRM